MIYLIRVKYEEVTLLKIGYTKNIKKRFSQYMTENPLAELLDKREGDKRVEFSLHKFFAKYKFDKRNEWFYYDDYIIDNFNIELQELYHEKALKEKIEKVRSVSAKLRHYCTFKEVFPETTYSIPWLDKYIEVLGFEKCSELDYDEVKLTQLLNSILYPPTDSEEDQILQNFLDNEFYFCRTFEGRLKLYCEFRDKNKDNPVIMEGLLCKVTDQRFNQYYNYFGTSGCRAVGFREAPILRFLRDDSKKNLLREWIYFTFKEGDRYSKAELKEILRGIYQKLSLSRTPKASDLKEYFELSKTTITTPEGKKNGFILKKRLM